MSAAQEFRLEQIGQIATSVRDLDGAVRFYRDTLGLRLLFEVPNLAFFDCAGVRLMLTPGEKASETYSSILYFKVDDIRNGYTTLKARGAEFEGEPRMIAKMPDHELWMAFFRDPDRNLLALMSEVRQA